MTTEQQLCKKTRRFWRYYLLEPTKDHYEEILSSCASEMVLVGTGRHELFRSLGEAAGNFLENEAEAEKIRFDILDEWYECLRVTDEVYLVYGGLWARQNPEAGETVLIDMDTRFSILYRRAGEDFEIVHIHHSMPYADQREGENYPKSLSQKAQEALRLAEVFQRRSELDRMTSVYNHESFHEHAQKRIARGDDVEFYLFDLDRFKQVNDSCGHGAGDALLKLFAQMLRRHFADGAVIGRLGGDEFAVCCGALRADGETLRLLREEYRSAAAETLGREHTASFSVGAARARASGTSFQELFQRADQALYRAKQAGRDACFWDGE